MPRPEADGGWLLAVSEEPVEHAPGRAPQSVPAPFGGRGRQFAAVDRLGHHGYVDEVAEALERTLVPSVAGEQHRVVRPRRSEHARDSHRSRDGGFEERLVRRRMKAVRPPECLVKLDLKRNAW